MVEFMEIADNTNSDYHYWIEGNGDRRKTFEISRSIEAFLKTQEEWASWPRVKAGGRDDPDSM
ncbi:MAG: hypothetical protein ACRC7O_10895, partial [Fimbriiglobus sp.]